MIIVTRYLSLLLFIFGITSSCYSQIHECSVTMMRYDDAKSLDNQDSDQREPELIGKFEVRSPSEGSKEKLSFPVKNTKMNVFVDLLYDDNLAYYNEWFHDAINMTMTISEYSKPDLSKSLSTVTTHQQHTELFRQFDLGTLVKNGNGWYDFWITCRVKDDAKQKELEKFIEKERKEREKEKLEENRTAIPVKPKGKS